MELISEDSFAKICRDIKNERDVITKHNPIGTKDETLLWMLLGCLIAWLSLSDPDIPCFTGTPNADTYRDAIQFVLRDKRENEFDADKYIREMLSE